MPNCEVCWRPIKGAQTEEDGLIMCEDCYHRTVPDMTQIHTSSLMREGAVWAGTYLLASGDHLRCHDCLQFDSGDWDEEDMITGSVYFEIDHVLEDGTVIEDWDGGEFGYREDDPFSDFLKYLEEWFGETVIQRISDED